MADNSILIYPTAKTIVSLGSAAEVRQRRLRKHKAGIPQSSLEGNTASICNFPSSGQALSFSHGGKKTGGSQHLYIVSMQEKESPKDLRGPVEDF